MNYVYKTKIINIMNNLFRMISYIQQYEDTQQTQTIRPCQKTGFIQGFIPYPPGYRPSPRYEPKTHEYGELYFCGNLDETKVFRVQFCNNNIDTNDTNDTKQFYDIEFGYYKYPSDDESSIPLYSVITLYNGKIYKSNKIKNNSLEMFMATNNDTSKLYSELYDRFVFRCDGNVVTLLYDPDINDEISTFIRQNGLFGIPNKLYLLK